ncbi:MAG: AI-2E family transporter [Ignavibacteriae bacterium]|nr:AI-2E family transporter [Ignavibacteriota bacterium]NOG98064.1 AI-2E family transporter [Ignavibacteriota bacterium]
MKKVFSDPGIKFFISVVGIIVIFIVLKELQHIFIPLVIAYFLFFVFEPLNNFLTKKKIPYGIAIFADIVLIVGVLWAISRVIVDSFSRLGEELPYYQQKLDSIIIKTAKSFGLNDEFFSEFNFNSLLSELDYGGIASGFFSSTLSLFSTVFFVLFFFIFVSTGHKNILEAIKKRFVEKNVDSSLEEFKKKRKPKSETDQNGDINGELEQIKKTRAAVIEGTFRDITSQIQGYIATKFLISLTTGALVSVILWLFGVDFVVVWGVLTFLLNFIPNIGSVIAVILPGLMTLVQFESFGYTILIILIIIGVQNVIGNILEPKIVGDQLGLNPLVILLSLLVWGYIWGIVGMFLSVPLTAIVKITISNSNSKNMKFLSDLMGN